MVQKRHATQALVPKNRRKRRKLAHRARNGSLGQSKSPNPLGPSSPLLTVEDDQTPYRKEDVNRVSTSPVSPISILRMPNGSPSSGYPMLSREREEEIVILHVRPFVDPNAKEYSTNTGAGKQEHSPGVSIDTAYTPDVSRLISNTGATKGSWTAGVDEHTWYGGEDEEEQQQDHSRTMEKGNKGKKTEAVFQNATTLSSEAEEQRVALEYEDMPADWAITLEAELEAAYSQRQHLSAVFSPAVVLEKEDAEVHQSSRKRVSFGKKADQDITIDLSPTPKETDISTSNATTSGENPEAAKWLYPSSRSASTNLPLHLKVAVVAHGIPNSLEELEDLAAGLAKDMNLAPVPGFLDAYGGHTLNLSWEMQKFGLDPHSRFEERQDHSDTLLRRLNFTSKTNSLDSRSRGKELEAHEKYEKFDKPEESKMNSRGQSQTPSIPEPLVQESEQSYAAQAEPAIDPTIHQSSVSERSHPKSSTNNNMLDTEYMSASSVSLATPVECRNCSQWSHETYIKAHRQICRPMTICRYCGLSMTKNEFHRGRHLDNCKGIPPRPPPLIEQVAEATGHTESLGDESRRVHCAFCCRSIWSTELEEHSLVCRPIVKCIGCEIVMTEDVFYRSSNHRADCRGMERAHVQSETPHRQTHQTNTADSFGNNLQEAAQTRSSPAHLSSPYGMLIGNANQEIEHGGLQQHYMNPAVNWADNNNGILHPLPSGIMVQSALQDVRVPSFEMSTRQASKAKLSVLGKYQKANQTMHGDSTKESTRLRLWVQKLENENDDLKKQLKHERLSKTNFGEPVNGKNDETQATAPETGKTGGDLDEKISDENGLLEKRIGALNKENLDMRKLLAKGWRHPG
ncbi:hypothetical protein P153DRAFT_412882 [Dothidotthia symphoricarpi CBS 119687]|uniref:Uncharacterized protein n=1 Tax=Dothidotthia symphoricarpi CBS 119687 TaxID=1392245 RepID=A0A6A6ARY8_9PLEO|nr:uncharacterized protein P153DRAFT_412882 [Dothidotthia symphoricarpi CBS 119687]KAF2133291.1 hypothetical protein P153DRAFT_412882 [Dothidotthia symphoricarpi CBS 119687]